MEHNKLTLEAVEVLKSRGLDASARIVTKPDGSEHECVVIMEEGTNLAPSIYTEYITADTPEELADEVVKLHQLYKPTQSFDMEKYFTREYLSQHIYPVVMPACSDDLLSRDFLDLKVILRVRVDEFSGDDAKASFALRKVHLQHIEISEDELFAMATLIMDDVTIRTMAEVLKKMMDMELEKEKELTEFILQGMLDGPQQYVVSNRHSFYGATNILNTEVFRTICRRENTDKLVILPSSVHELIVLGFTKNNDVSVFESMIGEVNTTAVAPADRLSDHPYYYWDKTGEVTCSPAWDIDVSAAAEKIVSRVFGE